MKKVGEILKKERQARGESLKDVSASTKIAAKVLGALEDGNSSLYPPSPYFRGFIRTYAKQLRLNPDEIIELLNSELSLKDQPPTTLDPTFQGGEVPMELSQNFGSSEPLQGIERPGQPERLIKNNLISLIFILLLFLFFIGIKIFYLDNKENSHKVVHPPSFQPTILKNSPPKVLEVKPQSSEEKNSKAQTKKDSSNLKKEGDRKNPSKRTLPILPKTPSPQLAPKVQPTKKKIVPSVNSQKKILKKPSRKRERLRAGEERKADPSYRKQRPKNDLDLKEGQTTGAREVQSSKAIQRTEAQEDPKSKTKLNSKEIPKGAADTQLDTKANDEKEE